MKNQFAKKGYIWVCLACGKRSMDLYGTKALDRGYDVSCMVNAVLVKDKRKRKIKYK